MKRLKTTEEGQRAGDLIRSLRSLAGDRKKAATAVKQGAKHWAKGELSKDKSYWAPKLLNKLKAKSEGSHIEENLLALAESHRQTTLTLTLIHDARPVSSLESALAGSGRCSSTERRW